MYKVQVKAEGMSKDAFQKLQNEIGEEERLRLIRVTHSRVSGPFISISRFSRPHRATQKAEARRVQGFLARTCKKNGIGARFLHPLRGRIINFGPRQDK